ncbi:glutaredoxin 3 [Mytilus galloprovincialis]|uniref:Glutaredoxin 3 n=1 Tax=Mytilus galloprovincialis TaxID=29158 RepID=A0A8B6FCK0_MYTGA|nr:glutaredoxin 3 [Mytilus galloprovincialis]
MSKAKVFVDGKIAGKKVVVFSKSYCPYCKKAKATLKKYFGEDEKDIIEIDNNPDCDAIQQYLGKITGAKSVPRIFINGKSIGGNDQLEELERKKELTVML